MSAWKLLDVGMKLYKSVTVNPNFSQNYFLMKGGDNRNRE